MINDLKITRHLCDSSPLDLESIDLLALARQVVSLHVIAASRQSVSITVHGRSSEILGDRTRLHRLIENLVSNAVKFSPGGGMVTVTVEAMSSGTLLTVQDEGMGIDSSDIDTVFDARHRSKTVEQAGIAGSGLGLAICKQIVEAHGGAIDVASRPGVGSTFRVELPLAQSAAQPQLDRAS
jgi:signal transduction histidine kinase